MAVANLTARARRAGDLPAAIVTHRAAHAGGARLRLAAITGVTSLAPGAARTGDLIAAAVLGRSARAARAEVRRTALIRVADLSRGTRAAVDRLTAAVRRRSALDAHAGARVAATAVAPADFAVRAAFRAGRRGSGGAVAVFANHQAAASRSGVAAVVDRDALHALAGRIALVAAAAARGAD